MRRTLLVILPLLLACAGLLEPKLAPRSFRAFSLDMLDGTVTEERDAGNDGDLTTEWLSVTQAVSWEPLAGQDLHADADELWKGVRIALASLPQGIEVGEPTRSEGAVGGQASVALESAFGTEWIGVAVWSCPDSGVMARLITGGPTSRAKKAHEAALATVRCGTEPVGRDASAKTWTFVGDPRRWTPRIADEPDGGEWERTDGAVVLIVSSDSALVDPDLPTLCVNTMREIHDNLLDSYTFDETKTTYRDTSDGCRHGWEGTLADGTRVLGQFEHHVCAPGRAYTMTCLVTGDTTPGRACRDQLACLPG